MKPSAIAEVISIGDEITCGKLLDTNGQWISQRLCELGIDVRFHTTLGDRLEDYRAVFAVARRRADLIVCSGGLGPTEDDLTTTALAELAGVDLEFDDDAWRHIASIFARRNRPIAPSNRKQALRPCGSRTIFNPHGTAPGIDLVLAAETSRPVRILAFPGVPAELREMWPAVSESIRLLGGGQVFYQFTLNCFGAGESEIEAMIPAELMRRGRDPLVGITASQATISLRVSTNGPDPKECRRKIEPTIDQLRRALGDLVYGEQDEPMPWVVARRVGTSGKTLAIADLGLSGELYRSLEETGQTGRSLCGGWQLASHNLMNAMPDLGNQVPTDKEYIREVAGRVRTRLAADVGLAIGPLADENAARQVFWVAVSDGSGESMAELSCGGHPAIRRIRALKQVLNFLRLSVFR